MTDENTIWHFLFLLFAIAGDGKELMDLMYSENFNEDFDKLIRKFSDIDSDDFKDSCLKAFIEKKEVAMELNKAYREAKKICTIRDLNKIHHQENMLKGNINRMRDDLDNLIVKKQEQTGGEEDGK